MAILYWRVNLNLYIKTWKWNSHLSVKAWTPFIYYRMFCVNIDWIWPNGFEERFLKLFNCQIYLPSPSKRVWPLILANLNWLCAKFCWYWRIRCLNIPKHILTNLQMDKAVTLHVYKFESAVSHDLVFWNYHYNAIISNWKRNVYSISGYPWVLRIPKIIYIRCYFRYKCLSFLFRIS